VKLLATAAILVTAFVGASAQAQSSHSSASLSNFTIQLIDLDLTDDITPTITFTSTQAATAAVAFDTASTPWVMKVATLSPGITTRTDTVSYGAATGTASLTAGSGFYNLIGAGASVSGSAAKPSLVGHDHNAAVYEGGADILPASIFSLSGKTAMIITAYADVSSSTFGPFDLENYSSAGGHASIKIGLSGQELYAATRNPGEEEHLSGLLTASFYNTSSVKASSYIVAQTYASGAVTAAVVPEPETYGMLLGGLGVLAAVARRRRQA
jgi:hypothetical protein